MKSVVISFVL